MRYDIGFLSISLSAKYVWWSISLGKKSQTGTTKVKGYACTRERTNQRSKTYEGKCVMVVFTKIIIL